VTPFARLRRLGARLRAWVRPAALDRDFAQELDAHVDMLAEDNLRRGMTADAARRDARIRVGALSSLGEQHREVRGLPGLDATLHDLRDAIRGLRRRWGFTAVAVATIGLGIGTTTTLFSVAYGLLFRPLPFRDQAQLVRLAETREGGKPATRPFVSLETYRAWQAASATLDGLAGWNVESATVEAGHRAPERVRMVDVKASLFDVLDVQPIRGALFRSDDESNGGQPIVILSFAEWQRAFDGRDDAIGQTIRIDGQPFTIVGIFGERFRFPDAQAVLWKPMDRTIVFFDAIARLTPGVSMRQAADEGTARSRSAADLGRRGTAMFGSNGPSHVSVTPLRGAFGVTARPVVLLVLGAGALLVLVATVNVASLQLTRAVARRRELAIRSAIGAGPGRLVRQMLLENGTLGALAGAAGLVLAMWLHRLLPALVPPSILRLDDVAIDGPVVMFAIALTIVVSLACGILPALTANRVQLLDVLLEDGQAPVGGGGRTRASRLLWALMAGQIAMAAALLAGTSLITRSFLAVLDADRGYVPGGLLTARLPLPAPEFSRVRRLAVLDDVLARLRATPGVTHAAATDIFPLVDLEFPRAFDLPPARPGDPVTPARVMSRTVSTDYFATLGMRFLRGRDFASSDTTDSAPVVVVNQTFVRRYLDGRDPLGVVLPLGWSQGRRDWQVIGLVDDVRQRQASDPPQPEVFACYCQIREGLLADEPAIAMRTTGAVESYTNVLRQAVHDVAPSASLDSVMTMTDRLRASAAGWQLSTTLLGAFALFAAVLVAVGLFGVLSYTLAHRSRELSVRSALGAQSSDMLGLVGRQVLPLAAIGTAVGIGLAILAARALRSWLFGVEPIDPVTLAIVPVAIAMVAAAAVAGPAFRALRTDPVAALRGR
jgi:predicted permease